MNEIEALKILFDEFVKEAESDNQETKEGD